MRIKTWTLDELCGLPQARLPTRCNVQVRIAGDCAFSAQRGGHWLLPVCSLSGSSDALVAVHRDPAIASLGLDFDQTSPSLLTMVEDEKLRSGFREGDLLLVQAQPRVGLGEKLYLNVPVVAIARPALSFGRQQIDRASTCTRRSYLSVFKGVRPLGGRHQAANASFSIGGELAHEAFAAWAIGKETADDTTELVRRAMSQRTLQSLVFLGLTSVDDLKLAVSLARKAVDAARGSSSVRDLIRGENWRAESDALNNGVIVAPDLLGERSVVELKVRNPESAEFDLHRLSKQIEGYLAWAMVELGVDFVCEKMQGVLVNLHNAVQESERVYRVAPRQEMIETRILRRHRLIALSSGAWLPEPDPEECDLCAFSGDEYDALNERSLPAACSYHCQVERHWDCVRGDTVCPLLSTCDQFDQYEPYERVDAFNRLREVLLAEEEEQVALAQLSEMLVAGGASEGFEFAGFKVVRWRGGEIRLQAPPELASLRFASSDQEFVLVHDEERIGRARFWRWRGDQMVLRETRALPATPAISEKVSLRFVPGGRYPARSQLTHLDRIQRSGEEPIWLRSGHDKTADLVTHETLSAALETAKGVLLVDVPGRQSVRPAVEEILGALTGNVLVVASEDVDLVADEAFAGLDPGGLETDLQAREGDLYTALERLIGGIHAERVWIVPRETIFERALATQWWPAREIDDVVLLGAETFPLLAYNALLGLSRRLIVIGDSGAGGPTAESPAARRSPFFLNSLRFLWDAGRFALPKRVGRLDRVRLPALRTRVALSRVLSEVAESKERSSNGESEDSPFIFHLVEGKCDQRASRFTLTVQVEPTSESTSTSLKEVRLELIDSVSRRELWTLLRSASSQAIERLGQSHVRRLDSTVLDVRVRILEVSTQAGGGIGPRAHKLTVALDSGSFPTLQERALENVAEAEALTEYAAQRRGERFHAVSPFVAQCVRIARGVSELGLENVRVFTPERLATTHVSPETKLLVSTVVGRADPSYPYPMGDLGRVVDLLGNEYAEAHIFCSPEAAEHHPLLRRISGVGESPGA